MNEDFSFLFLFLYKLVEVLKAVALYIFIPG